MSWVVSLFIFFIFVPLAFGIGRPLATFEDIENILEIQSVQSFNQLINHIPIDLRERYTFMHESRSRQGASYEFPRAILFSHDAQFVLSFAGHPSQHGYNEIELMQFDSNRNRFLFATVDLPTSENNLKKAVLNRDSRRCLGCHGTHINDLHPIWDSYPFWRGAYGGEDDGFGFKRTLEKEKYIAFLNGVASESPDYERYRTLPFRKEITVGYMSFEIPYPPYGERRFPAFEIRPNHALHAAFMRLNARRVAQNFFEASRFGDRDVKKNILRTLLGARCAGALGPGDPDYDRRYFNNQAALKKSYNRARAYFGHALSDLGDNLDRQLSETATLMDISKEIAGLGQMKYSIELEKDSVNTHDGLPDKKIFSGLVFSRLLEFLKINPAEKNILEYPFYTSGFKLNIERSWILEPGMDRVYYLDCESLEKILLVF